MNTSQTSTFFKVLQITHFALVAGVLIFAAMSFAIHQSVSEPFIDKNLSSLLLYIVPIAAVGGVLASNVVFRNKLLEIKAVVSTTEKLDMYRTALIIRYAILEGSSLAAIVSYFFTANIIFLGITGIVILYFVSLRPTKEKAIFDLELDADALQ